LLVATAAFPLIAALLVEARTAVLIVLGDQWLATVSLIRLLAPVAAVQVIAMTTRWVCVSLGCADRLLRWRIVESAVKLSALAIGIRWGASGVALGLLTASSVLMLPGLWYCFQGSALRLHDAVTVIWRPLLASVVAAVALGLVRMTVPIGVNLAVDLAIDLVILAVVYLGVWFLMPGGRTILLELLRLTTELRSTAGVQISTAP
jgi:PST family polysaccharide transporter